MAATRMGLRVRKLAGAEGPGAVHHTDHVTGEPSARPWGGVIFLDEQQRRGAPAPRQLRIPHDYAEREHWIERINPRAVVRAAGPASAPMAKTHTFPQCDELVLHMADGVYRYKVVGQPDKYNAGGTAGDYAGDPSAECRWYYDADLITKET